MVVMYHYVRESAATRFPGIRALPPPLFERQLDWLQANYAVVGVPELEAAIDRRGRLPSDAALLTFDDGFVDHYETVLPILRDRGLEGVFFMSGDTCGPSPRLLGVHKTHFLLAHLGAESFGRAVLSECREIVPPAVVHDDVFGRDQWEEADARAVKRLLNYELQFEDAELVLERLFKQHIGDSTAFARQLYLTSDMIREMVAEGMTFGYHTQSHRMLSRLSPRDQEDELRSGVEWATMFTSQRTVPFCYPWGGKQTYTASTLRILGEVGYSLAFNTVRRRVQLDTDDRYELPRFDTRDLPPYTQGEADAVAAAMTDEG